MAAFFIVSIQYPEGGRPGQYETYLEMVLPIVERFGGKYRVRSDRVSRLAGEWAPDRVIVIEFPSREDIISCFESPEYRWIKDLREFSVNSSAVIVEEAC